MSGDKVIVDRRCFYTSMFSVVIVMVSQGIVVPHINLRVLDELGLFYVSLLTLGFMSARSLSSLLHAMLYELYSARITGFMGLTLLILCYILYVVSPVNLYPLIRVLEGFASGLFWPLMQTLISSGVSMSWRSRVLSIYFLLGNIAGYLGYIIGGLIYVFIGSSMIIYMGLLILSIYIIVYVMISPNKKLFMKHSPGIILGDMLREIRNLGKLLPLILLVGGVNGLLKDYVFAYVKIATGYDEPTLRNYWSIIGYIGLLLSILFSHIYEALHHGKRVLLSSTIMTLLILTLLFTNNPFIVLASLSLTIVGVRTLIPLLRGIASNRLGKPEYGIALVNSLSNISAGIAPFIIASLTLLF